MHIRSWSQSTVTLSGQPLPLTRDEMANHLLHDWLGSFTGPGLGNLFGWLDHVMEEIPDGANSFWAVDERLSRTDRQWKGVFSWMIAIMGTRHVLAHERYRWIAPVSAFLPDAPVVDLARWPRSYPPARLRIHRTTTNGVRLLPDYVAIPAGDAVRRSRWALVESKGTPKDLTPAVYRRCPRTWRDQSHNGNVQVGGRPLQIHRRIVIATRVNPGGTSDPERILQARVWNSADSVLPPGDDAAAEVAAAHLFGLCLNLGLMRNAEALARGAALRNPGVDDRSAFTVRETAGLRDADAELEARGWNSDEAARAPFFRLSSLAPAPEIELAFPIVELIRQLRTARVNATGRALRAADEQLDDVDGEFAQPQNGFSPSFTGVRVRYRKGG